MTGPERDWWIYTGSGEPHDAVEHRLPEAPPWRTFAAAADDNDTASERRIGRHHLATAYQPDFNEIELINAALYLRRPLLVTGKPGTGKSTLAYSIAHELNLGPVLRWSITSRSTLADGLYRYDAIGRLQAANLNRTAAGGEDTNPTDIGSFIRLGPLGTALLPGAKPRMLLIDEIDKSDVDLPNDLLNAFEEGEFVIPELERVAGDGRPVEVRTGDRDGRARIADGRVRCTAFPFVLLTSNGERDFPTAFLRRCVRLDLRTPNRERLIRIVEAHLGMVTDDVARRIDDFLERQLDGRDRATDQLLNALYLASAGTGRTDPERRDAIEALLRPLTDDDER
ncbi:MoxR family ATPase [Dactylosporangium sp. NPDC049742]|uniref:AAA family ATPase n=1 Tax=Dactylosporangium sp. NPDC049742 TaxID=3154737 RepID=UPI003420B8BE